MIPFHPFAEIFPLLDGEAFDELAESVRLNGVRDPIMIHDGAVLDGRNRYRALLRLRETGAPRGPGWGVYSGEPVTEEDLDPALPPFKKFSTLEDGDPLAYVIDKNLRRRHLNDDQRRMAAARLANLGRGRPKENPADCGIKVADAARMVNVDEAGTERARTVLTRAEPEIRVAVDKGHLTVAAAAQAAKLEPETQRSIAEQALAGRANVVRTVIKKEARASRERDLAAQQLALPHKLYGVILADPEWRFEPYSRETGLDRAADNHYATSATADICARPIDTIAAPDCVLFLWATAPMLIDAIKVMDAWGFSYKSHLIWRKIRNGEGRGSGYWFTGEHELLLVGACGRVPAPATALCGSVIDAPWAGRHSAKPAIFAALIERAFPSLPKIELNRRGPARPGWDAWGAEALPATACDEPFDAATGEIAEPPASDAARSGAPQSAVADIEDIPAFLRRRPVTPEVVP